MPANLVSATVKQDAFETGQPLLELPIAADTGLARHLVGVQGRWLSEVGEAKRGSSTQTVAHSKWLWPLLTVPGTVWLILFFLLPMYVVLAIVFGRIDPVFRTPLPVWNPLKWNPAQFNYVFSHVVGKDGFFGPALLRTLVFVVVASLLCLLIAYPVAYFTARFAGRRKGLILTLLIAPFWISYMMRMLAWVNLLQNDGLVNRGLSLGGFFHVNVDWLSGRASTVIIGLVYGYVPYMILPLFAGLDRIQASVLEAARDLGRRPAVDVLAGDLAAQPARGRGQRAAVLPADARRLLHQRPAVGLAGHVDGRQPDQQLRAGARADRSGGCLRAARPGRVAAADALVRPDHARRRSPLVNGAQS